MKRTPKYLRPFVALDLALALAFSCLGPETRAQDAGGGGLSAEACGADQTSPLGARQQRVKRLLNDLETKFTELATKLREEQPDQAKKLEEAFKQSKELLLMQRMDEITTLLDAAKLESATDEQDQVIVDLKELIDLLLYEESEYERLQREIEQLERWKEALDDLIQEEGELREESEDLADPENALSELQAQIDRAKKLIEEQEALAEATAEANEGDVDAIDQLADQQAELQKQTRELADSLKDDGSAPEAAEGDSAREEASQSLEKAAGNQAQAEDQLAQGNRKDAGESESKALENLREALKQLEEEQARQEARDAAEASNELAQQQSETAAETRELGDEMAAAEKDQEGAPSPSENVQNAQQQMNQAAQQLGQNQPGDAAQNQARAEEELERARQEIERQLNELRDQAQQEQIARLEEVFKQMLERQRLITQETRTIAERRGGEENRLRRADRIRLRKWINEERSLQEDAQRAEQLLVDDGTSIVFRDVVGHLGQEIGGVAELMDQQQTGPVVQQTHVEIEATLEELVEALKNSGAGQAPPPSPPQEGANGQPQEQRQSLFPPLAELKLLKFTQERINRQTQSYEKAQSQAAPEVFSLLQARLRGTAEMQDNLTNMTRQLAAKIQPTVTEEDPNAID